MQLKIEHVMAAVPAWMRQAINATAMAHRIAESAATAIMGMAQATHNPTIGAKFRPVPWPPLRDGRPALLIRTGRMAHSYRVASAGDAAMITTDAPYAMHHQTGATIPPHTVPATSYMTRAGRTVHRRSYQHPGARLPARPFLPIERDATGWRLTRVAELMVGPHIERAIRTSLGL